MMVSSISCSTDGKSDVTVNRVLSSCSRSTDARSSLTRISAALLPSPACQIWTFSMTGLHQSLASLQTQVLPAITYALTGASDIPYRLVTQSGPSTMLRPDVRFGSDQVDARDEPEGPLLKIRASKLPVSFRPQKPSDRNAPNIGRLLNDFDGPKADLGPDSARRQSGRKAICHEVQLDTMIESQIDRAARAWVVHAHSKNRLQDKIS